MIHRQHPSFSGAASYYGVKAELMNVDQRVARVETRHAFPRPKSELIASTSLAGRLAFASNRPPPRNGRQR